MPLSSKVFCPFGPKIFVIIEGASVPAAVAVVTTPPHTTIRNFYRETPFAFLLSSNANNRGHKILCCCRLEHSADRPTLGALSFPRPEVPFTRQPLEKIGTQHFPRDLGKVFQPR